MAVDRIAHAEYPALGDGGGVGIVDGPGRRRLYLDRNPVVADQLVENAARKLLGDLRWAFFDVVSTDGEPSVPGPEHADDADAKAGDARSRLVYPVEPDRPMRDNSGQ